MGIYEQIVEWSAQRPRWQQDALRRLAQGGPPTAGELAQWAQMARTEAQGGACGAVPLESAHVPAAGGGGPAVCLSAMSDLQNVNAIANGQCLQFPPTGLTAVYGDNGAGKSGYARVLKSVCHARGAADPILSDVFSAAPAEPRAELQFKVGQTDRQFQWAAGAQSPSELARISVFDSVAAVALLEQDNEVLWTPGGLDLLVRLVEVVQAVREALVQEESNNAARWQPPPQIVPGTSAAQFVSKLSAATTAKQIEAIRLTAAEEGELARTAEALKVPDPLEVAKRVDQRARRVHAFQHKIAALETALGDAGIAALKAKWQGLQAARQAELALATETFSDSALTGVGSGPWNALWRAAEAFAASGATSDKTFPSHASPCLCVLCQQPVAGVARDRLGRFHAFVRSDVARQRESAGGALRMAAEAVQRLDAPDPSREPVLEDLRDIDAENAQRLPAVLAAARTAKLAVTNLLTEPNTWPELTPLPKGWAQWARGLVGKLEARTQALREAAKPEERRTLIGRQAELASRRSLYAAKAQIEAEIARLRVLANLAAAKKLCATRGITELGDALTKEHVTDRMMAAFAREAGALRVGVAVEYGQSAPRRGRSFQRMKLLASGWATDAGPSRVLSEGERRAVALAAFFAELDARDDRSCIVFDDPVSSLDHDRRAEVARRLVEEALHRQVVVFTHDLVFLKFIEDIATREQMVPCNIVEVRRTPGAAVGVCTGEPPWRAMKFSHQVKKLNSIVTQLRKLAKTDPARLPDVIPRAYGRLRQSAERALEERLLGGCVERFSRGVHPTALWKVRKLNDDDVRAYLKLYDRATTRSQSHDPSRAENPALPTIDDFEADVKALDDLVKGVTKRS